MSKRYLRELAELIQVRNPEITVLSKLANHLKNHVRIQVDKHFVWKFIYIAQGLNAIKKE
jgi:hypothetical protein